MRILAIADLHWWLPSELDKIENLDFDICVLCGDFPEMAIQYIDSLIPDKPIYGIPGNHDDWNKLERNGIENIHGKVVDVCGYKIAGFGGSPRYKEVDCPMFTQREAFRALNAMPRCDILISHESAYHLFAKDMPHGGFLGINWYLGMNRVKLNICGHHHINAHKRKYHTDIFCVFRCAVVSYPDNTITHIF